MRAVLPVYGLMAASLCSSAADAADSAAIFMYHHVALDTPRATSTPPEEFAAQLAWLEQENYRVLGLLDVLDALANGRELPERVVAITFDDGYRSVLTEALPLLAQRRWPFTVFVNTEAIDSGFGGYLSWDDLRRLGESGATIGNHSVLHAHLVRRAPDESASAWRRRIVGEIEAAERRLEAEVGEFQIPVFAYPYGEYTDDLAGIVADRGLYGLGQHSGAVGPDSDFRALPRYPVATGLAIDEFALRARSRALPVERQAPERHIVADGEDRPVLALSIDAGDDDIVRSTLACYASGQGLMPLDWLSESRGEFEIRPEQPLPAGRSKVNCTAQSRSNSRVYYWWGHLWMRRQADGRWYDE